MDAEVLPLLIGSSGVTALIIAVIGVIVNRRKLSADVTNIISEAASGVVQRLEAENQRVIKVRDELEAENRELKERVAKLERKDRERDRREEVFAEQVRLHLLFDEGLQLRLIEAGIEPPDAPPLEWPEWTDPYARPPFSR